MEYHAPTTRHRLDRDRRQYLSVNKLLKRDVVNRVNGLKFSFLVIDESTMEQ
jgi:hypothetical protein